MNKDQMTLNQFAWRMRAGGGLGVFDTIEEFVGAWVQRGMRGLPRAPVGMSVAQIVAAYRAQVAA